MYNTTDEKYYLFDWKILTENAKKYKLKF